MTPRTVAVLGYHKIGEPPPGAEPTWFHIPEATFAAQLQLLRAEEWQVVDLDTFIRGLDAPEILPTRSAMITFDDGCRSLGEAALRVLTSFGFPAVVFVPSAYIGKTNSFDAGIEPEEPICDWPELQRLEHAGIAVQSHSATHPRLSELDATAQEQELVSSKAALETGLGRKVKSFAYPFGDSGSDAASMRRLMRSAGYDAAFLYGGAPFRLPFADRFHLPRIAMGPDTDLRAELQTTRP